jgi:NAD(P)-dependent dehydrogenase (short-subunit alcohol dehydrogenase family)
MKQVMKIVGVGTSRRNVVGALSTGLVAAALAKSARGQPGQPAELAGIYVLLASAESSYATGQVYGAVGGRGGP